MAAALLVGSSEPHDPGERAVRAALRETLGAGLRVAVDEPRRVADGEGLTAVDARSRRAMLQAVRRCDLVVAVGEGATSEGSIDGLLVGAAAASPGTKLALIGVSSEPRAGAGARFALRGLLRACDLCVVADRSTALTLRDAGAPAPLRIGSDPAWSAIAPLPFPGGASDGDRRRSKIVVAFDRRHAGREAGLRIAAGLQPLAGIGSYEIELQPWLVRPTGVDDVEVAHAVAAALGPAARVGLPPTDLTGARNRYAQADLVVAMGPRALIAAAAAGTRTVVLSDHAPTRTLAERLLQPAVGTDSAASMSRAALIALDAQPPLGSAVRAEIDAAHETLRLLRVLAAEGRTEESEAVRGLALEPRPGS
jgi:polysaccharide pyruvyl transferase WcaK-like protein